MCSAKKSVFITRACHQTTFHALHTEVMMTSGDLLPDAVAVATAEIIQIRKGREKTPAKWKVANSGESMSPILPMTFLL